MAAIYARVSSARQKQDHTIASQTTALRGFAEHLGDRLAHQHPRERRATGEVPREEPLVAGEAPSTARRAARLEVEDLVDEQERRTMWQELVGSHGRRA